MSAEAEPDPAELRAAGEKVLPLLLRAAALNIARPIIPALALGSALVFFAVDWLTPGAPGPRELVRMFALPPMDAYSDLATARSLVWFGPLLLARAGVVAIFVSVISGRVLRLGGYVRVCLVTLGGSASFVVLYLLGLGYLRASVASSVLALIVLGMLPAGHLVMAVIFSTMAARAGVQEKVRPLIRDRAVWIFAAASTWIWMFLPSRIDGVAGEGFIAIAYCLAFAGLFAQSTLFTAIVLRSRVAQHVVRPTRRLAAASEPFATRRSAELQPVSTQASSTNRLQSDRSNGRTGE